jgi:hypothetical protein
MQLIKKRMFDNNSVVANFISIANALSELRNENGKAG